VIEKSQYGLTWFKVAFGRLQVKAYTEGEHVPRFEATAAAIEQAPPHGQRAADHLEMRQESRLEMPGQNGCTSLCRRSQRAEKHDILAVHTLDGLRQEAEQENPASAVLAAQDFELHF